MTAATLGVGTVLALGDGASPEAFTAAAEILSLGGPDQSAEEVEVTSLQSTGGFKEFIAGLKDGGSVTFGVNWVKTASSQHVTLRDRLGGAANNYRITFSDSPATVFTFSATVLGFSMNTEPNAAIQAEFTLKISGQGTWA